MLSRLNFTALAMYTLLLSAGSLAVTTKPEEPDLLSGEYPLGDLETVPSFSLTTNQLDINQYLLYDSMNTGVQEPAIISDPELILLKK